MKQVTKNILKKVYKERPANAKKYDYGILVVIGGSEFYSGSPALSALAAFRAGVDMVRIIAPKRAADIIASFKPDLAAYPLKGDFLSKEHLATLLSMTESAETVSHGKTAVVIGGGVGRNEEAQEVILEFLSRISCPVVIDAGAIHALGRKPEIVSKRNFLITPHTFEFFVMTGREIYKLAEKEKIKAIEEEAARLKTTILVKGKVDVISNGKDTALNKTGCAFMTVGGMGDTLAGIAGALMARGVPPFEAGQAAAYINGLAGEKAAAKLGEGVMATDLIECIPQVLL